MTPKIGPDNSAPLLLLGRPVIIGLKSQKRLAARPAVTIPEAAILTDNQESVPVQSPFGAPFRRGLKTLLIISRKNCIFDLESFSSVIYRTPMSRRAIVR
jgi:hypothetical protein